MIEAIKVAGKSWKVLIIQAKKRYSSHSSYHGSRLFTSSKSSVQKVFNEQGDEVTSQMKWIQEIISFASIKKATAVSVPLDDIEGYRYDDVSVPSTNHVDM